ncbi:membrane protein [Galliscardovia ingluviei]|uniref:Membrane protein n=1 Tax=Galliscardovia ingluviei TaxID=1769422 RepID=A0A8J3ANF1_9BIFI|nr:zinc ribbon domain-containing protein [Galliscardovia ingluviei]GGI13856.1 membrane protein [Galliscardovia ingluviei]
MKNCSQCGAENPATAKFCRKCGHPFTETVANNDMMATPVQDTPAPVEQSIGVQSVQESIFPNVSADEQTQADTDEAAPVNAAAPGIELADQNTQVEQDTATEMFQQVPQQPMHTGQLPDPQFADMPQAYAGSSMPAQPVQSAQPMMTQPMPAMPNQGMPMANQQAPAQPMQGMPMQGQPAAQNSEFINLFKWMWQSFLRPSHQANTQVWWPIVSFAITSFVMGLTTYMWQVRAVSAANSFSRGLFNMMGSGYSGYAPSMNAPISGLFKGWILSFILLYAVVLIAFIGYRILGDATPFASVQTKAAQRLMPANAFLLAALLFGLVGGGLTGLSVLLYVCTVIMFIAAPGVLVAQAQCTRKADRTWLWIVTCIIGGIIVFILLMITAASGIMSAVDSASSLFGNLNSLM